MLYSIIAIAIIVAQDIEYAPLPLLDVLKLQCGARKMHSPTNNVHPFHPPLNSPQIQIDPVVPHVDHVRHPMNRIEAQVVVVVVEVDGTIIKIMTIAAIEDPAEAEDGTKKMNPHRLVTDVVPIAHQRNNSNLRMILLRLRLLGIMIGVVPILLVDHHHRHMSRIPIKARVGHPTIVALVAVAVEVVTTTNVDPIEMAVEEAEDVANAIRTDGAEDAATLPEEEGADAATVSTDEATITRIAKQSNRAPSKSI